MPGSFSLEIVTPERLVYAGEVDSLVAPGLDGSFGILHNRAPLIAALGPGPLAFSELGGARRHVAISGGFFQILDNRAIILADDAQFAEEIDRSAAEASLAAARAALAETITSDAERQRRQRELEIARARVRVATRAGGH